MPQTLTPALQGAIQELSAFHLFHGYTTEQLEQLCAESRVVVSGHRDRIIQCGDAATCFGVVLSGAYKLSRPTPQGEDAILHFSGPGDVIAAFIMAQPTPHYPLSATAMGPSRFLAIPRKNYLNSWKSTPELVIRIQNLLSHRMGFLQSQRAMLKAPLPSKVATLLLQLVATKSEKDDLRVPIPLTRREIAETLGVTVESVIRVMSEWSKQGLLSTDNQYITLNRPDVLVQLSHPDE